MGNLKTQSICALMKIGDTLHYGNLKIERRATQIFHIINLVTEQIFEVNPSDNSHLEEIFKKDRAEIALPKIHYFWSHMNGFC